MLKTVKDDGFLKILIHNLMAGMSLCQKTGNRHLFHNQLSRVRAGNTLVGRQASNDELMHFETSTLCCSQILKTQSMPKFDAGCTMAASQIAH